jgi:hypothetical protein
MRAACISPQCMNSEERAAHSPFLDGQRCPSTLKLAANYLALIISWRGRRINYMFSASSFTTCTQRYFVQSGQPSPLCRPEDSGLPSNSSHFFAHCSKAFSRKEASTISRSTSVRHSVPVMGFSVTSTQNEETNRREAHLCFMSRLREI